MMGMAGSLRRGRGRGGVLALCVLCCAALGAVLPSGVASASGVEGVMGLTAHHPPIVPKDEDGNFYTANLLYREFVRQGVLMIARDQFGLATRDQVLREELPGEGVLPGLFDIEVAHMQAKRVEYTLSRGDTVVYEDIAEYFFGQRESTWVVLKPLYEQMYGPVVEALEAAGLEHRPLPVNLDGGGVTAEMEAALGRMDVVSQFTAVRLAHEAMREHGETRDLIGVLSRGYGNLGQFSMYHNSAMRFVFVARGLWYATRLIELEPDSPVGYWCRSYAGGVFGYQQQSIWDLSFAADRLAAMDDPPAVPRWVELIDLANRFRYDDLEAAAQRNDAYRELAAFLWYRSAEFAATERINIETGRMALEVVPHCMRIHEGINRVAGVRWGHRSTTRDTETFNQTLPAMLREAADDAPGLSGWFGDGVDGCETVVGRHGFAHALRDAAGEDTDTAEPSVAVLGMLIDEQNVMQIAFRAMFLRDRLGRDSEPYLMSAAPALDGHPHRPLVMTLSLHPNAGHQAFARLLEDYGLTEGSMMMTRNGLVSRMPTHTRMGDGHTTRDLLILLHHNAGIAEPEYTYKMIYGDDATRIQYAKWAAGIIPYAPIRFTTMIYLDWDNARQHADEWEEAHGHHPDVAYALASRYEKDEDPHRALALYEKYRRVSPDYNAHYMICAIHWRVLDDPEEAMRTANAFFEEEDYGLEHANLAKDVAFSWMAEGDYEAALPWAQRAARSGAYWALSVEAYCYEHLGMHDEAMRLWRRADRSYRGSGFVSAMYRLQADPDDTWRAIEDWNRENVDDPETNIRYLRYEHDLLTGDPAVALDALQALIPDDARPFHTLLAGLLAGQLGDENTMRGYLQDTIDLDPLTIHPNLRDTAPTYIALAQALLEGIDAGFIDTDPILEGAGFPDDHLYPNVLAMTAMAIDVIDPGSDEAAGLWWEVAMSPYRWRIMPLYAMRRVRDTGEDPMTGGIHWRGFRTHTDLEFIDQ